MWPASFINRRYQDMSPRKRRASLRFLGRAKFLIAATFSGFLLNPSLSTKWPKYLNSSPKNWYFLELGFSLTSYNFWNITAAEAHRELQKVYGDAALSETTCRDWFRRFKDGNFDFDNRPREAGPKTFKDAELEALLDEDPCQTEEELASALGVNCQVIFKWLHASGIIQKQGTWVPYDLKPRDVERHFSPVNNCFSGKKGMVFLIASVGVIYYELFKPNETITADRYRTR